MSVRSKIGSTGDAGAHPWRARRALLQRKCACGTHTVAGGECDGCGKKGRTLQRTAASGGERTHTPGEGPEVVQEVLGSPGRPLDSGVRSFMEPRFRHDFSRVRVHTDSRAAESARSVNALAYTVGRDVVFDAGQYAPHTAQGRKLIAHELAHTVQQSAAGDHAGGSLRLSRASDGGEVEAEQAASDIDRAAAGALQLSATRPLIQRMPHFGDPIHGGLVEDYRRRSGLPPSGVDEEGRPVGPSEADIKYGRELCPKVGTGNSEEELREATCRAGEVPGRAQDCIFRPEQEKFLSEAMAEAARRARRASGFLTMGPRARSIADELAHQLFLVDIPTVEQVTDVLDRVATLLEGDKARFAGRTCANSVCQRSGVVAYVSAAGALPISICPLAFSSPAKLYQYVFHEALHWAGIDADAATKELYCSEVDCKTACGGADVADAWMHYLTCLGAPVKLHEDYEKPEETIPGVI